MSTAELERALAELSRALREAGLQDFEAPRDAGVIERIETAIAPLRLPAVVRRFWELVDAASISVHHHPALTTPGFALQTWERHVSDLLGTCPRVLFPIAYESHAHLFVELDLPGAETGGAIFSWCYTEPNLRLVFADLVGYVSDLTAAMQEQRTLPWGSSDLRVDAPSLVDEAPGLVIHPAFGPLDTIAASVSDWPEPWRILEGTTDERTLAIGADHTIGQVLRDMQLGPIAARIHAKVTELAGSADGAAVTVSDGIDRLRIWCPRGISPIRPSVNGSYEFHITAPADRTPRPPDLSQLADDQRLARLPIDIASVAARLNHANRPVDAVAKDVRPLA